MLTSLERSSAAASGDREIEEFAYIMGAQLSSSCSVRAEGDEGGHDSLHFCLLLPDVSDAEGARAWMQRCVARQPFEVYHHPLLPLGANQVDAAHCTCVTMRVMYIAKKSRHEQAREKTFGKRHLQTCFECIRQQSKRI